MAHTINVGGKTVSIVRGSSGITLVSSLTFSETQILTSSDAQPVDNFGYSIAIDGTTMVIGAIGEDAGGSNAGAAYVFEESGGNWTQVQKLVASDAQAGDQFGISVAISGTVISITAFTEDAGGSNAGAAYVFEKSGSWLETQKLVASDAAAGDLFGYSTVTDGTTVIVGAGGAGPGAAYVFEKSGTWLETQKLTASDAQADDRFGFVLALKGTTLVVSALDEDTGGLGAGAAYVFEKNGSWLETQKLMASDAQADDQFGYSVSIDTVIVIGAYREDASGSNSGAAYVFEKSGSWLETQKLTASDAQVDDNFGISVGTNGITIIVGAYYEDGGTSDPLDRSGAIYVFNKSGSWLETQKIGASDAAPLAQFGWSINMNGSTAIIGSKGHNGNTGATYVFGTI